MDQTKNGYLHRLTFHFEPKYFILKLKLNDKKAIFDFKSAHTFLFFNSFFFLLLKWKFSRRKLSCAKKKPGPSFKNCSSVCFYLCWWIDFIFWKMKCLLTYLSKYWDASCAIQISKTVDKPPTVTFIGYWTEIVH